MSTLAVVERILQETEVPMSVKEIVEYAKGALPTKSKTPDTVVARDLSMDIKKLGDTSRFIRTAPGRYTMRAIHARKQQEANTATHVTRVLDQLESPRAPTLPAPALHEVAHAAQAHEKL